MPAQFRELPGLRGRLCHFFGHKADSADFAKQALQKLLKRPFDHELGLESVDAEITLACAR